MLTKVFLASKAIDLLCAHTWQQLNVRNINQITNYGGVSELHMILNTIIILRIYETNLLIF